MLICPGYYCHVPCVLCWWLVKVEKKNEYAYMKPDKKGDRVVVEIVKGEASGAPSPNVGGRPELAECLLCGSKITYVDPETGRVYRSKDEVKDRSLRQRLEIYPMSKKS